MSKIRVMIKRCGQDPQEIQIENALKPMQKAVGGYIEIVPMGINGIQIICDEEGMCKGKSCNFALHYGGVICGTALFCRTCGADLASLTDDDVELIRDRLDRPRNDEE